MNKQRLAAHRAHATRTMIAELMVGAALMKALPTRKEWARYLWQTFMLGECDLDDLSGLIEITDDLRRQWNRDGAKGVAHRRAHMKRIPMPDDLAHLLDKSGVLR